jgi:hypothetical protein
LATFRATLPPAPNRSISRTPGRSAPVPSTNSALPFFAKDS